MSSAWNTDKPVRVPHFRGGFDQLRRTRYDKWMRMCYRKNHGVPFSRIQMNAAYKKQWTVLYNKGWNPRRAKGKPAWTEFKKQSVLEAGILQADLFAEKEALWIELKLLYPEIDISENIVEPADAADAEFGNFNPDLTEFLMAEAGESDDPQSESESGDSLEEGDSAEEPYEEVSDGTISGSDMAQDSDEELQDAIGEYILSFSRAARGNAGVLAAGVEATGDAGVQAQAAGVQAAEVEATGVEAAGDEKVEAVGSKRGREEDEAETPVMNKKQRKIQERVAHARALELRNASEV